MTAPSELAVDRNATDESPSATAGQHSSSPGLPLVGIPDYEVVTTNARAEAVADLLSPAPVLALDIETCSVGGQPDDALDPAKNRVRLLQLAANADRALLFDVAALGGMPIFVADLLASRSRTVVGFNLRFDASNILKHYGIEIGCPVDLYAGAVLADGYRDHRVRGAHSLGRVVQRYLNLNLPKELASSDWGAPVLSREQLDYAARDSSVLLPLYAAISAAAVARGVADAWRLENEALPAVVAMERAGIGLDRQRLGTLVQRWASEADAAAQEVRRELGGINLNSPPQVTAAVQARYGIALASTSESALSEHVSTAPALASLLVRRRLKSRIDTAQSFIEAVHPDGRVRARFNPLSAPTGRFGCSSPNLLAVPKEPEFRSCFVAGYGHKFVIADYAAIQLRIVADISGDPELVRCFASNPPVDPHRRTAAFITGKAINEISKEERQLAKAVNFGLAFGMGARRFVIYARDSYGVVLTMEEAEHFRDRYFALYEGIRAWHRRTGVVAVGEAGVRTASGRYRELQAKHGRVPFTDFLNTPVQGTEADGVKRALALLHPRLREFGAEIVNVVHDELVVRTPSDVAEVVKPIVVNCMVEGMGEFVRRVPVVVEADTAETWTKA